MTAKEQLLKNELQADQQFQRKTFINIMEFLFNELPRKIGHRREIYEE
jgi:hypothetical protein